MEEYKELLNGCLNIYQTFNLNMIKVFFLSEAYQKNPCLFYVRNQINVPIHESKVYQL